MTAPIQAHFDDKGQLLEVRILSNTPEAEGRLRPVAERLRAQLRNIGRDRDGRAAHDEN